jgi:CRISPR-associated endonuclease/helicase Cas3
MTERSHVPNRPGEDGVFLARPGEGLEEHLTEVSSRTGCRSSNRIYGEITGLLHDVGKYSLAFRAYLRANSGQADEEDEDTPARPDHSSAGAQLVLGILRKKAKQAGDTELERLAELIGRIVAHPVVGHHSGLLDSIDTGGGASLDRRLKKEVEPYACNLVDEISRKIDHLAGSMLEDENLDYICRWINSDGNISGREAFSLQFVIRMLFSALVDGDRLDSERAGNPVQWKIRTSTRISPFSVLLDKLEEHLNTLPSDGIVNEIRKRVSERCRDAAAEKPGFFSLTVPTGGGKTFASLRFALHHAKHGMRRVIYVMPYTTIIDQNADEFRKVLDPDGKSCNVLEHHSNLEPRKETLESKLLADNWESPIVVTTSVQFFESLYAAQPSRCRRLHSIRQSIIILDEAQTFPVRYLKAVTWVLEELVTNYGCSVIFCTATQPLLDSKRLDAGAPDNHRIGITDIRAIIPEPQGYFEALQRVHIQGIKSQEPLGAVDIASRVEEQAMKNKSVLCILNTKRTAKAVFTELKRNSTLDASAVSSRRVS